MIIRLAPVVLAALAFSDGGGSPGEPSAQDVNAAVRKLASRAAEERLEGMSFLLASRDRLAAEDLRLGLAASSESVREACAFLLGLGKDPKAPAVLARIAVEDADPGVRSVAFDALKKRLGEDAFRPLLSAAVSAPRRETRLRALARLEELGEPRAVGALVDRLGFAAGLGTAAATAKAAAANGGGGGGGGGDDAFSFSGTQTALVTDFDVEVAQGAVIADPIVTPVTSGALLRVRNVHVSIHPREREAIWAAILASSGRRR